MKKLMFIFPALFLFVSASFAQTSVEFIPSGGYTFGDRVDFYDNYGKINGAANLSGSFVFNFNRLFGLELMYNHMNTTSGLYNYGGYSSPGSTISQGNLSLDYIMLGPVQSFNIPNSPVRPFIGAMLGASIFTPGVYGYSNDVKFAWGVQMGTNIYFTPRIGIRLKAQLLAPVDASQGGFYAGSDGAGPIGVSGDIYQFGLNAGLVIGLGRVMPEWQPRPRMQRGPRYRRYAPYPYY